MLKKLATLIGMAMNGMLVLALLFYYQSSSMAQSATQMTQSEAIETILSEVEHENANPIYPNLVDNRQAHCLALNVYYEARSDNLAGQYAVSDVVLNRVRDARYPNTICDVVMQGPMRESWKTRKDDTLSDEERVYYPVRNMCQFSWYCDGKDDIPDDETGWATAQMVAGSILFGNTYRGITEGATHYHATYVKPDWRNDRGMQHVGRIGSHIFYRWE